MRESRAEMACAPRGESLERHNRTDWNIIIMHNIQGVNEKAGG